MPVKTLAEYQAELQDKVNGDKDNPTYSFRLFDNRFSLVEWSFLFAAFGKLMRIMLADSVEKVADDAIDVEGYIELFWQQFGNRNEIVVTVKKPEFHR